jgi:glycosyltransferase 2 family protein
MRTILPRVARVAVATGLTAYMLWLSRPGEVAAAAAGADWRPIVIAVLLVLVDRVLMAYRWVVLLYTAEATPRPPLSAVLRIFFISTFVGTFLPSVGGDALRAYSITRFQVRGGDAVASVFMDRMLGVASILVMALGGLLLARNLADDGIILAALAAAAGACAVTLLLVFSQRAADAALRLLARLPGSFRDAGDRLLASIRRYGSYRRQLVNVLVCSVAVQALRILQAYFLGRSLGIELSLGTYFAVLPLILLIMLLPVTISGLGTGQAAFLWFFAQFGVPAAHAFALSILFIGLAVIGNLPGGILYALGPERRAAGRI